MILTLLLNAACARPHQKINARTPITTANPIRKMMPTVLPMNFNMFPLSVTCRGRLTG
jgi:hypothetical protein